MDSVAFNEEVEKLDPTIESEIQRIRDLIDSSEVTKATEVFNSIQSSIPSNVADYLRRLLQTQMNTDTSGEGSSSGGGGSGGGGGSVPFASGGGGGVGAARRKHLQNFNVVKGKRAALRSDVRRNKAGEQKLRRYINRKWAAWQVCLAEWRKTNTIKSFKDLQEKKTEILKLKGSLGSRITAYLNERNAAAKSINGEILAARVKRSKAAIAKKHGGHTDSTEVLNKFKKIDNVARLQQQYNTESYAKAMRSTD